MTCLRGLDLIRPKHIIIPYFAIHSIFRQRFIAVFRVVKPREDEMGINDQEAHSTAGCTIAITRELLLRMNSAICAIFPGGGCVFHMISLSYAISAQLRLALTYNKSGRELARDWK